jgi:hypothetical protein
MLTTVTSLLLSTLPTPGDAPLAAPTPPRVGAHAYVAAGASSAVAESGAPHDLAMAMALGAEVSLEAGGWVFGLGPTLSTALFEHQEVHVGLSATRRIELTSWLTADVGADAGVHHVWDIGQELFVSTTGDNTATLPFVGARAALTFRIPLGPTALDLSLALRARADLGQQSVAPTMTGLFVGDTQRAYEVGGQSLLGGLVVGVAM